MASCSIAVRSQKEEPLIGANRKLRESAAYEHYPLAPIVCMFVQQIFAKLGSLDHSKVTDRAAARAMLLL